MRKLKPRYDIVLPLRKSIEMITKHLADTIHVVLVDFLGKHVAKACEEITCFFNGLVFINKHLIYENLQQSN